MYLDYLKINQERVSYSDFMLACIESTNELNTELFNIQKRFIMATEGASEVLSAVIEKIKAFFRAVGKFLKSIASKLSAFINFIIDKVRNIFLKIKNGVSAAKEDVKDKDKFYIDIRNAVTGICFKSSLTPPSFIFSMINSAKDEEDFESYHKSFEKEMTEYTQYASNIKNIIKNGITVIQNAVLDNVKSCERSVNSSLENMQKIVNRVEKDLDYFDKDETVADLVKYHEDDQEWMKEYVSLVKEYKRTTSLYMGITSFISKTMYSLIINGLRKYSTRDEAIAAKNTLVENLISGIDALNFEDKK